MPKPRTLSDLQLALALEGIRKRLCTIPEAAGVIGVSSSTLRERLLELQPTRLPRGAKATRGPGHVAKRIAAFTAFYDAGLVGDGLPPVPAARWTPKPDRRRPSRGRRTKEARAMREVAVEEGTL